MEFLDMTDRNRQIVIEALLVRDVPGLAKKLGVSRKYLSVKRQRIAGWLQADLRDPLEVSARERLIKEKERVAKWSEAIRMLAVRVENDADWATKAPGFLRFLSEQLLKEEPST